MRILFLYCDGVINSHQWFEESLHEREQAVKELRGYESWTSRFELMIDPKAVVLVDEIIERGGAHVVVSSSWRIHWELWQIAGMFKKRGSKTSADRFIDRTPNDRTGDDVRGHEIQRWLDQHPEVEAFVILDDDSDMAHLTPKLVQTSWGRGIEREHVERAVAMLGGAKI